MISRPARCVLLLVFSAVALSVGAADVPNQAVPTARQLVVVTTSDWNAVDGTLQRYQRKGNGWRAIGSSVPVVIGRNGLGWGVGLQQSDASLPGPSKQEGDGRSPAGIFGIGAAFGYDADKPRWLNIPYIPLTSATECVDDRKSAYYNAVVDRVSDSSGWDSSEKMRQIGQYRWGIIVNYNPERVRSAGSCIFLHLWGGPHKPTAGCTAMEETNLEKVMRWLRPSAKPLLVALPRGEYRRLRQRWRLP